MIINILLPTATKDHLTSGKLVMIRNKNKKVPWRRWSSIYRVSQEECARLREGVPYVNVYRYNPKHLCPKLNGYGDKDQRSLKLWQLLLTYWLPNTYWNWQEYVVSVMLISVHNSKVICEWHKAIKQNYKNTRTRVIVVHWLPTTIHCKHLTRSEGRWELHLAIT